MNFLMQVRLASMHTRQRRIMHEILSDLELNPVLDSILETTAALVQADEAYIRMKDPVSNRFRVYPKAAGIQCRRIFKNQDLCQEIMSSGEMVCVPDVLKDPRVEDALIVSGVRSFAAAPAVFHDESVGVLYAFRYAPFDYEKEGVLPLPAGPGRLAGQAIQNLSHFAQAKSQNDYMASLVKTSEALTQALTDEEQFTLAWEYISNQLKVSTFYLGLFHPKSDSIHFPLFYDNGERGELADRFLGENQEAWGISGFVVKTGMELCWRTRVEGLLECQKHQIHSILVGQECESCFYMPLKMGSTVLGVLSIQSYIPYAFDEAIRKALQSLGNLLVVGLEKNRLYREEKNRRHEAEILRESALQVSAHLDLDCITHTTLLELQKIVPYDCATVQLFQEEEFEIVACNGFADPSSIVGYKFPIRENNPNRIVFEIGRPFNLADAPKAYPDFNRPPHSEAHIRSWLGVPMIVGGEWIGLIDMDSHEVGHFTQDHEKLALALATNSALAIRNAQSMRQAEQTSKYIQSVFEAGADILSAPDSNQALRRIVDTARSASNAFRTHVLLMEEENLPQLLVQSGFDHEIHLATSVRKEGISWQVFRSQVPFYKSKIHSGDTEVHPDMVTQGVRAAACLPLIINHQSIGVLWIHFDRPHEFSQIEKNGLWSFATQSAIAYDRIRMLEEVVSARDEVDNIARKSTGESHKATLLALVTAVRKVLNCDSVSLYEYNQDRGEFGFPPTILGVKDTASVLVLRRVSRKSVLWQILQLDEYHQSEDAQNDPLLTGSYDRKKNAEPFVRREKIAASLSFPLKIGSRKVGVMFINYCRKHSFTAHELINAGLFANQAAVVIHNAQLHEESTHRAELLKALGDAGLVAGTNLKLDDILEQITKKAWEMTTRFGDPASLCNLSLVHDSILEIHTVYPKDVNKSILGIDLRSEKIGITGLVVTTGKTQLVGDTHGLGADSQYIVFDKKTRSELAVPIFVDGEVRGVLNVESHFLEAFDEEDQRSLEALAIQAGIALKNSQIILQNRPENGALSTISGVLNAQIAALPTQQVLQMIVDTIRTYAGAWRAVVLVIDPEADDYRVLAQAGFYPEFGSRAAHPAQGRFHDRLSRAKSLLL